jgi:hypothetical protein
MQPKTPSLNKLVSLTFDEDPKVRRNAAKSLGDIDDPAAIFALVELSYDKDLAVKKAAQDILDKRKKTQEEVMSFAEIFKSKEEEKDDGEKEPLSKKERVLQPITKIFERKMGKEKAARLKSKMMPAIEKIYQKSVGTKAKSGPDDDKTAMQEFLTSYLEAVSDIGDAPQIDEAEHFEMHEELAGELEVVGTREKRPDIVSREIAEIEADEIVEQRQDEGVEKLPDTTFKKAYETMMLSGGDDSIMRKEMKRLIKNFETDAKLAYNLAKKKFKETKITHLTKLKDGMRNINTDILTVHDVEHGEYAKTKKRTESYTRVLVHDEEQNEGIIYLFEGRGSPLKPEMNIRVVKGYVKSFDFSGETAIAITKGNVYIVL